MKEFKIKLSYRSCVWITEEMCTQDPIQAMMKVAELSHSVADTMSPNGRTSYEYQVSIEVKDIGWEEAKSPATGIWYDCKLNGEPCDPMDLFSQKLCLPDGDTVPGEANGLKTMPLRYLRTKSGESCSKGGLTCLGNILFRALDVTYVVHKNRIVQRYGFLFDANR